jgi:hypothetical protein
VATETIKVLGQSAGTAAASTYALLYAVPTSTTTVISTIAVCNTASTAATYRISLSAASATPTQAEHIVYGSTLPANDTAFITAGITMSTLSPANVKFLMISSSASTVSFSAYGVETV